MGVFMLVCCDFVGEPIMVSSDVRVTPCCVLCDCTTVMAMQCNAVISLNKELLACTTGHRERRVNADFAVLWMSSM